MELEYDVDKLLNDIKQKDVKSMDEIEEINKEVVDIVYSNFIKYKDNKENKKECLHKIKNKLYEYVDSIDDLTTNDTISSLDMNEFFNLKFKFLGFFVKKQGANKILIKSYTTKFWVLDKEKHILFRKLTSKDKVNMMLVDTINNL